jgi:hypothetical protein
LPAAGLDLVQIESNGGGRIDASISYWFRGASTVSQKDRSRDAANVVSTSCPLCSSLSRDPAPGDPERGGNICATICGQRHATVSRCLRRRRAQR